MINIHPKKRFIFGIIILALTALIAAWKFQTNNNLPTKLSQQRPISILLLGVDQGIEHRHDQGNSDSMMLITLNPAKKETHIISIPRDLLAKIQSNRPFWFKINSAYQVGNSPTAIKTTSKLLNTPIDYYMEVNMKTIKEVVNELGGVDVQVPFNFTYHTHFKKGKMHLNGRQALNYSRMRYDDPQGDYGRQLRQRQIITSIGKKLMNITSIAHYQKISQILAKNIQTNIPKSDLLELGLKYKESLTKISGDYLHAHDAWINGTAIEVASTKELQRISNKIRLNLNLSKETLDNAETQLNQQQSVDWNNLAAFQNYQVSLLYGN